MKASLRILIACAALAAAQTATAQNLSSAYFLDGFAYGHQLNPAKDYDRRGYFSLPILPGNLNIALRGNMGVKDFFYKNPGGKGMVTYLHPDISPQKAMDAFHRNNKLLSDVRYDLLSFGTHAYSGFNTFSLGLRSNLGVNIPYELFDLTKNIANKDYDISNFGATATAWFEVALGHSHPINRAWRIGGKLKFLVGAGYANLKMDRLRLNLAGEDQWTATANAQMEVGLKGFKWGETKTKEYKYQYPGHTTYEQLEIGDMDDIKAGINGLGFGMDLGLEWNLEQQGLIDGLTLSASLLDLGFIKWRNVAVAVNRGDTFVFDGFNDIQVDDGPGESLEDQADRLGDRLSDLYSLQDGGSAARRRTLGATLVLAAEYALPSYRHLKFGLLSTSRLQGVYSWNEERLSVTLSPAPLFELSCNAALGSLGANVGWVLNFHPRAFSLFIGSDHCVGRLSKQMIPLRSNYDFCMGINFPFGKSRFAKQKQGERE